MFSNENWQLKRQMKSHIIGNIAVDDENLVIAGMHVYIYLFLREKRYSVMYGTKIIPHGTETLPKNLCFLNL